MKHHFTSRLERLVESIQQNSLFTWFQTHSARLFPAFALLFISLLVSISMYKLISESPKSTTSYSIHEELDTMLETLTTIDANCSVISVRDDKNLLNFLTVKQFLGTEVGCFQLANPSHWKGPYAPEALKQNYELVRAADGFYITPATHSILPNRRVMGIDVSITPQTDMKPLLSQGGALLFEGKPLARKVHFAHMN